MIKSKVDLTQFWKFIAWLFKKSIILINFLNFFLKLLKVIINKRHIHKKKNQIESNISIIWHWKFKDTIFIQIANLILSKSMNLAIEMQFVKTYIAPWYLKSSYWLVIIILFFLHCTLVSLTNTPWLRSCKQLLTFNKYLDTYIRCVYKYENNNFLHLENTGQVYTVYSLETKNK